MPHAFINGCDTQRCLQQLNIHIEYVFKPNVYNRPLSFRMMEEINDKIGELVKQYFTDYTIEEMTNHEYNVMISEGIKDDDL